MDVDGRRRFSALWAERFLCAKGAIGVRAAGRDPIGRLSVGRGSKV
ncbi:hypothetical protein NK8_81760 (plasmid) [Caballeronia sp. NK8]|nr:hypothetical protein NK8_81760 [Caballeronia sp. NK8]